MGDSPKEDKKSRREVLAEGVRIGGVALAAFGLGSQARSKPEEWVWQIDPELCIECGLCATECVMTPSAVKAVHAYAICGFCRLCFGMFRDRRTGDTLTAENMRCPTDALKRTYIMDPYYQISVEEPKCIGCAVCIKGCELFGNGSLFLQIRHDRCLRCNQCAIAQACPPKAIVRVPASEPYKVKKAKAK